MAQRAHLNIRVSSKIVVQNIPVDGCLPAYLLKITGNLGIGNFDEINYHNDQPIIELDFDLLQTLLHVSCSSILLL